MGNFLSIPHELHDNITALQGNTFQVYLLFLRCVTFRTGSCRKPVNGTEYFEYPFSRAKKHKYSKSRGQFWKGIQTLINLEYVEIVNEGRFDYSRKKKNLYRLLKF